MKSRSVARRLALSILYEAEIREMRAMETWASHVSPEGSILDPLGSDLPEDVVDLDAVPSADAVEYARRLVNGVDEHRPEIDGHLTEYADRWALTRMPVVDRCVLRIAVFELLWGSDVPVAVAINEAVELVKSFSTEDSGRFINGLLGRIYEEVVTASKPHPSP